MGNTHYAILGTVAFVLLAAALFVARGHYLRARAECGHRLERLAPALQTYAEAHGGLLPTNPAALRTALGDALPVSTIGGLPYEMTGKALKWKTDSVQPYLWDARPHDFVNGVHVLFTDGRVRLLDAVPREAK